MEISAEQAEPIKSALTLMVGQFEKAMLLPYQI